VASYVYDALGRRTAKQMGSVRTRYLYDLSGHVVTELQTAPPPGYTGWTVGYVYLNGQLLAQYSNGTTYFAHKDHLGSTRVLTPYPYAGAAYESYDYLPFGEQTAGGIATKHKIHRQRTRRGERPRLLRRPLLRKLNGEISFA
jgi:hypothetical protein